ncbi:hypothetical protein [Imhoffiella purpurea]|uniref:hypothetical protein n=1 Tax=Imhoffiella purpurea TaxID=1249627 RepID=UPI0012FD6110|nr:hypothetical protein [Imhoffiella purpurea]
MQIVKLENLYSDFRLRCFDLTNNVQWAIDRLERGEDLGDYEIAVLASATEDGEIINLTRRLIVRYGDLRKLEPDKGELVSRIYQCFPVNPIPQAITEYFDNDPRDYDGEGQSVTDFFLSKAWPEVKLDNIGGYVLTYMREGALLYYLPSFLMYVVTVDKVYKDLFGRIYSLFGHATDWEARKASKVVDMLDSEKICIVRQSLEYGSVKQGNIPKSELCRIASTLMC